MPEIYFGNVLGGVDYLHPPGEHPVTVSGITGELFTLSHSSNIVPTINGYGTSRGGSTKLNSNAYGTTIKSAHEYIDSSGNSHIYCTQSTVIGEWDGADDFDNVKTGMSSVNYGQWINYGGYAIYADGNSNPQKLTYAVSTTVSDLTADQSGLPGAKWLIEWGQRVWTCVGAKLYGSALRAPTDFSTTTVDIGYWEGVIGDENDDITGLATFNDLLLIGKKNRIYALSGEPATASSTFSITQLFSKNNDSVGFSSGNAIVNVGNDLVFLDGLTIKRLSGVSNYGDIESYNIIESIQPYVSENLDAAYSYKSSFAHYKRKEQVWCTIPLGSGSTRFWFVIDYSNQSIRNAIGLPKYSIFPMAGFNPTCFISVSGSTTSDIWCGCDDGHVRLCDYGYTDSGDSVSTIAAWSFGGGGKYMQPVNINFHTKYVAGLSVYLYYALGLQEWDQVGTFANYTHLQTDVLGSTSGWNTSGGATHKVFDGFYQNTGKTFTLYILTDTTNGQVRYNRSSFRYRSRYRYY